MIEDKFTDIPGWCPAVQGYALSIYAEFFSVGGDAIVELGTFQGRSTAWIASRLPENFNLFYSVDPNTGHPDYAQKKGYEIADPQKHLARHGLDGRVNLIRQSSTDFANEFDGHTDAKVGLLYIDADHAYESVKEDFFSWLPRLSKTSAVVFDDYTDDHPGVVAFVNELLTMGIISQGEKIGHAYFSELM